MPFIAACAGAPTLTPTPTQTQALQTVAATPPSTQATSPAPTSMQGSIGEFGSSPLPTGPFPATMLGLPVMGVSAAYEALGTGELDGRFAAVAGEWRPAGRDVPGAETGPDVRASDDR